MVRRPTTNMLDGNIACTRPRVEAIKPRAINDTTPHTVLLIKKTYLTNILQASPATYIRQLLARVVP
jgi:hypothetical protein